MSWGLTLEEAARFHGHLGPWLVIGFRAGRLARESLKPFSFSGIQCVVRVPLKTPYSCIIDGIQASACCTLGKNSIRVEDSNSFEFIFTNIRTGSTLRIKLRRDAVESLSKIRSLDEGLKYITGLRDWEIFELS